MVVVVRIVFSRPFSNAQVAVFLLLGAPQKITNKLPKKSARKLAVSTPNKGFGDLPSSQMASPRNFARDMVLGAFRALTGTIFVPILLPNMSGARQPPGGLRSSQGPMCSHARLWDLLHRVLVAHFSLYLETGKGLKKGLKHFWNFQKCFRPFFNAFAPKPGPK